VTYTPSDTGTDTGWLEITSDDPDEPNIQLNLDGTGAAPPAISSQTIGFAPPSGLPVGFIRTNKDAGGGPYSSTNGVAIGDLDQDGNQDLAVAVFVGAIGSDDTVAIFLGDGTGSFGPANNFLAGPNPEAIAIGDLDQDGDLDIAVASIYFYNPGVSILLNDGTGSFGPPTLIPTSGRLVDIAIDDLDKDGDLDLAVANEGILGVTILLGDGTGSFGPPTDFNLEEDSTARTIAVGDLNGDTFPDVAVGGDRTVSVLLGDGTGSLGPPTEFIECGPVDVAIADLNWDGYGDIAATNGACDVVLIFLGDSTGVGAPTSFPAGDYPLSVAIGDLNKNGFPDLAVTNLSDTDDDTVSILLGDGTGFFGPPMDFSFEEDIHARTIAIGDFNRDGYADLTTANSDNTISIFLNTPGFPVGGTPTSIAVGELNDDGILDLAIANLSSQGVSTLFGLGGGFLGPPSHIVSGSLHEPSSVAIEDLDGDGNLELFVADKSSSINMFWGSGPGAWDPPELIYVGQPAEFVAIGDFDGNSNVDLAATPMTSSQVTILLGSGSQSDPFGWRTYFSAGGYWGLGENSPVAIGDFDGDGNQDLTKALSGEVAILLGDGTGSFGTPTLFSAGLGGYLKTVAIGDFNKDNNEDLVVVDPDSDYVYVLLGNGDGSFSAATGFLLGLTAPSPQSVVVEDFNKDGKDDLAVVFRDSDKVSVLLGNGDGTFASAMLFPVPGIGGSNGPQTLAVGDFNNDGWQDLAVAKQDRVTVLLNSVVGSGGGIVGDPDAGASFSVDPGVLATDCTVAIEILDPPPAFPPPGFQGDQTLFVNFTLDPNLSPLPEPGATITLPLDSCVSTGTQINLSKFDPTTDQLVPTGIVGTVEGPVGGCGTVATFSGVRNFSVFVGFSSTEVEIDIKPGSDPNCFNSDEKGVIPLAILGSADFDAATVDPFTVSLDGAEVRLKGKSGNAGSLEDVNGDGVQDLVVQIIDEGGYSPGDSVATLSGLTFDGITIEGEDSICIVQ
jgi:hypothetical protein